MKPHLYLRIVIHSGTMVFAIYRLNPNQDATDAAHDITIRKDTPGLVMQRIIHKKDATDIAHDIQDHIHSVV